jgi:hypothetical protein
MSDIKVNKYFRNLLTVRADDCIKNGENKNDIICPLTHGNVSDDVWNPKLSISLTFFLLSYLNN